MNFNHPVKSIYWVVKLGKYTTDNNTTFLAFDPYDTNNMLLSATRRFVLRCAKYENIACTKLVSVASKISPLDGLPT